MNTSKMAEISEVISSIAIVITLIVLIFEIRSNTEEVRAATIADIAGRTQGFTIAHMTNPEVEQVWNHMVAGNDLSDSERGISSSLLIAALKVAEESYIAYRDGRLDEEIWQTRATLAITAMNSEQVRNTWINGMRNRGVYIKDFEEWLYAALIDKHGERSGPLL